MKLNGGLSGSRIAESLKRIDNMSNIFREGGPHKIKRVGSDQYQMSISLPPDADGRLARSCPSEECSPGYFKIKLGTGLPAGQESSFCPYCRHEAGSNDFSTKEQMRYAEDLMTKEVTDGVSRMLKDSLGPSGKKRYGSGMFSVEMSYKPGASPRVRLPIEDELRRDIICPHCGLDHSVYGLATWCADCGRDIFLTHVETEQNVVKTMLNDLDRRYEVLGSRVVAKDLENCLEDVVSIFEASLKAMVIRYYSGQGKSKEDMGDILKKIGNCFQSIARAGDYFRDELTIDLVGGVDAEAVKILNTIFEMRHPITHNLGVVDRKYLERVQSSEQEGKEIRVNKADIEIAMKESLEIFKFIHKRLFGEGSGNADLQIE